jgi:hypothetical protein
VALKWLAQYEPYRVPAARPLAALAL